MSKKPVYLFVFDGLADWEPAFAVAGINEPEFQKQPLRYSVRTVAERPGSIVTMGGLRVEPDLTLASMRSEDAAMLILPGGEAWNRGENQAAVAAARAFARDGISVAAICAATLGLARGGLLDDIAHTSNSREFIAQSNYAGATHYVEASCVSGGPIITAAGTAPVDFAAAIFRNLDLYPPETLEAWLRLFKADSS